jgi:Lon protease-like protein
MRRGYRRVRGDFARFAADLDLAARPIEVEREALLAALRSYFAKRNVDANWDAIRRMPDDALVVTLAMVCPFEPAEKQALLEAPSEADRAATLLALLQMGAAANDASSGRPVS